MNNFPGIPQQAGSEKEHSMQAHAGGRLILTNGTVVTRDAVIEHGSVVIEGEQIAEVSTTTYPARLYGNEQVIDVGGRFVLPGIVCLHNDGLEKAINPRPNTNFPTDFALQTYDTQLAAAGITTQFHAISFQILATKNRSVDEAVSASHAVHQFAQSGHGTLDHYVLFRCDVRQPISLDTILTCIEDAPVRLVSINDHVPGQGQYRDIAKFLDQMRDYMPEDKRTDAHLAEWHAQRMAFKENTEDEVARSYARLATEARARDFVLASHDDDSPEKVELMHSLGCRMAEFPVTVEAARRARELGMLISIGAPNAVRGGSLTGNASATALARLGLVDILIADYHAPSILYAAWRWAHTGIATLPEAVAMMGANPAAAAGLHDRGTLVPGARADVIVVEEAGTVPVVTAHVLAGAVQYQRFGMGHRTVGEAVRA